MTKPTRYWLSDMFFSEEKRFSFSASSRSSETFTFAVLGGASPCIKKLFFFFMCYSAGVSVGVVLVFLYSLTYLIRFVFPLASEVFIK